MSDSNLSNIKTGWVLTILIGIVFLIVIFYAINFNFDMLKNENWSGIFKNLSKNTGNWGAFGDYAGGILNPVIAAFAFYLIAKTYELQKTELEATRELLKDSIDTQDKQLEIAALTALLNSNLTNISALKSEISFLFNIIINNNEDKILVSKFNKLMCFGRRPQEWFEHKEEYETFLKEIENKKGGEFYLFIFRKTDRIEEEIEKLKQDNEGFKKNIKKLGKFK